MTMIDLFSNPVAALIIDGILIFLLIGAIAQGLRLHRALKTIRSGQDELSRIVGSLNQSVTEAQRGVIALKSAATEAEEQVKAQVVKASALVDELTLITEAGNNLADRIEGGLTGGKSGAGRSVDQKKAGRMSGEPKAESKADRSSRDEQKALLEAIKTAR